MLSCLKLKICELAVLEKDTGKGWEAWHSGTRRNAVIHPATQEQALTLPCLLLGRPPCVVVLDPFAGSASTGGGCRHAAGTKSVPFIGQEISPGYAEFGMAQLAFEAAKITDLRPQRSPI